MERSVHRDRLGEKERSLYDAAMLKIDQAKDDFYEHTTDDEFNALDDLNGIIGSWKLLYITHCITQPLVIRTGEARKLLI